MDALIARRERFLANYQNAAHAAGCRALVDEIRAAERNCVGAERPLHVTAAVARNYAKLLAHKDEYEVARLYSNGEFARQLDAQFEGDVKLEFHLAPPLISRPGRDGSHPRKLIFGRWMWTAMKVLARLRFLRGTPFNVFAYMLDRRVERELIRDYAQALRELARRAPRRSIEVTYG